MKLYPCSSASISTALLISKKAGVVRLDYIWGNNSIFSHDTYMFIHSGSPFFPGLDHPPPIKASLCSQPTASLYTKQIVLKSEMVAVAGNPPRWHPSSGAWICESCLPHPAQMLVGARLTFYNTHVQIFHCQFNCCKLPCQDLIKKLIKLMTAPPPPIVKE